MYICVNEKAKSQSFTPFGIKKERNERTPADNQTVGAKPLYVHLTTKLARKIFFASFPNLLIFITIFLKLNCCN